MNDGFALFAFLSFIFIWYGSAKSYQKDISEIKERLVKIEVIIENIKEKK